MRPAASAGPGDKIQFYSARIKSDPSDIAAYVELGKLEESQEFYSSALRRLYAARALGASESDIILPLGRALTHLSRWDEAQRELAKATTLMPDSVEAAANLAGVQFSSGSADEASKTLSRFVDRHRLPGGGIDLSINDLHRIMLCFSEARDPEMSAQIAQEIIRVSPKDAGAYAIAGHALLLADRYDEALPYFAKAAAIQPDEASLSYNYGVALEHTGREEEALKQFQRCVMLNSSATDGFIELAALYEKKKDWKPAAAALSNAALHSKTNTLVLYRAGKTNEHAGNLDEANYWYSNSALSAGKHEEALKYARKLMLSANPAWRASGLLNAAEAYRGEHKMKEFLEMVRQSATGGTAKEYLRLADAYEKADLLEKQVAYLKLALAKEPKLGPLVHSTIAQTMQRRGLRDEAEKELELAVAGEPGNASYHVQLGAVYFERRLNGDRLKRAIEQYLLAARLDPKDASNYQNLGIACSAAGDFGHAAFYLEHAIDLESGYGPSYQELGRVYAKMGDKQSSENMLALYHKYVRYDLRLKTLVAKADQNKKDAAAQIELADMQARSGGYASALQGYRLALELKPKDKTTEVKYQRAVELLTQKRASQTANH